MAQYVACPRIPVSRCPARLPTHFIEGLEQNQQIASCCRHPENHDIEAFYSCEAERDKGIPDIYVFHCTCGRDHTRLMVGGSASEEILRRRDEVFIGLRNGDESQRQQLIELDRVIAKGIRPYWEIR